MNINWKKALAITAFVGATIGIGYLLYYLFWRPVTTEKIKTPEEIQKEGTLPSATTGGVKPSEVKTGGAVLPSVGAILKPPTPLPEKTSEVARGGSTWTATLTTSPVQDVTLASGGQNLQYYNKSDGKFYRITSDGEATAISDKVFRDVQKVNWSPDANKSILEFPDGSNVLFDFNSQKQITLPKHWEKFDFSPSSSQIAGLSIGVDPDNRWLFISNPDGTNAQTIEPLGENADKVKVSWSPNNQVIATSRTGEALGFDRQMVLLVGKNGENFKGLTVEGRGFDYKWSPTGKNILYNVYSSSTDYKPLLWISGAQGDDIGAGRKSLGINTWAEKCAYADEGTVYCAVPKTLDTGAGLVPSVADYTPDVFYKIDTRTGLKSVIATPYPDRTATSVSVSADGRYLFFVDRSSGQLQRLKLK